MEYKDLATSTPKKIVNGSQKMIIIVRVVVVGSKDKIPAKMEKVNVFSFHFISIFTILATHFNQQLTKSNQSGQTTETTYLAK